MDTPLDKKLIGNQDKLPEALKAKIEAAPESPAKFLGGLSAAVGSLGGGSGGGSGSGNILDTSGGIIGIARRVAALNKQRKLPNSVMNAAQGEPTVIGSEDPLNDFSRQKFEITPVQMNNQNYTPGNEQGSAKPLFNEKTKKLADGMFGQQLPGTFDNVLAMKNFNKKY
jgi:hypothetical protein